MVVPAAAAIELVAMSDDRTLFVLEVRLLYSAHRYGLALADPTVVKTDVADAAVDIYVWEPAAVSFPKVGLHYLRTWFIPDLWCSLPYGTMQPLLQPLLDEVRC